MVKNNKFLKDNLYLLVGTGFLSVSGFFFHFFMGRSLGPEDYGVLASVMAVMALIGIFISTLQLSISKFVASFKIKKKIEELNYLFSATFKKLNKLFFILWLLFLGVNIFLSSFLEINYWFLFVASFVLLITPSIAITRGFMQGLQNFRIYGICLSIEGFFKLFLGIGLVLLGFGVGGVIAAIVLSYFIAVVYAIKMVKKSVGSSLKKFESQEIYHYTLPVFFTVLFFTAFYSFDLLLVKHFFPAVDAGNYAVVSLLGKIIFFASFSIIQVMYPKVVELSENGGRHKDVLLKSFLVTLAFSLPLLTVYYFFGGLVVNLLFGSQYLGVVNLIAPYGLFMLFVSLSKMFSLYLLSFKKYLFLYLFGFFLILEIVLLSLSHASLTQVVNILLSLGFLFTSLMGYLVVRFKE